MIISRVKVQGLINRYEHVTCRKSEGAHYTPSNLSKFVSDRILERANTKQPLAIADPAIGDGELILSLLQSLDSTANVEVIGFDINAESITATKKRLQRYFPDVKATLIHADFLDYSMNAESLLIPYSLPKFDVIIANPPYVRTQVLGAEKAQSLAKNFGLKGRVDIYQAFLVSMHKCMSKDCVAGVIVSNRFLTTKGCGALRQSLFDLYDIHGIWDFGDTKLFEAAVLPAVLLYSLKNTESSPLTQFRSIYETSDSATSYAESVVDAISMDGVIQCVSGKSYRVKSGALQFDSSPKDTWRIRDIDSEEWLNHVKSRTWATFGQVGKIRVGVKTTADNVFIRNDWQDETGRTPELIRPLITHHVAGRFKQSSKPMKQILYTHESRNGKKSAVDMTLYPISYSYLNEHRKQLEGRGYIAKAKRNWYEIWVPQNPDLWLQEKVVFRDICEEPTFWLDTNKSVVNGDCYWMVNEYHKEEPDIVWLILAVANSKFIEKFYDTKFNNKLYSNKRRFISQYVEQFPLPDPQSAISREMVRIAKLIFNEPNDSNAIRLEHKLNNLVWEAFDLPLI